MGRPLYTTALLARYATEAIHNEPPKPAYPVVEKWTRWNPFDPDSDEFFESDSAVYEDFLVEEEIAERAQTQQRESTRLLAETLLREADGDGGSVSSSTTAESGRPAVSGDIIGASRSGAMQMEIDVQYTPPDGERAEPVARRNSSHGGENETSNVRPARRQPRRSSTVFAWRDLAPASTDITVPRISVFPVEPASAIGPPPHPSSPDLPNTVSGLDHLSESPRPLVPTDSSDRAISPIPNTPARVSGVFATPPSADPMINTLSPLSVTPRILSWGSETRRDWLPDSPTSAQRTMFHYMGSRLSAAPAPLTY